jgi:hypothetical protein
VSESGSRELLNIRAWPEGYAYGDLEWTLHMHNQFRGVEQMAAEAYPGTDAEALRRQAFFKAGSYRFIAEHALVALMQLHNTEPEGGSE